MEGIPGWAAIAGNLGGIALAVWLLFKWKGALESTISEKDKKIDKLEAANADLHDKLIGTYRETIPVLAQAGRALELVADVIPTIAAAEPARLRGPKP